MTAQAEGREIFDDPAIAELIDAARIEIDGYLLSEHQLAAAIDYAGLTAHMRTAFRTFFAKGASFGVDKARRMLRAQPPGPANCREDVSL